MKYLLIAIPLLFCGCENLKSNMNDESDKPESTNSPIGRSDHSMLWTGSKMLVIGGFNRSSGNDGYLTNVDLYDPERNIWTKGQDMPSVHTDGSEIVWTGSEALVMRNPLIAYNPTNDDWRQIETSKPIGGKLFVWTGNRIFVCCTGDNSESAAFVNPTDGSVEEVPGFAFPTNGAPFSGIIGMESTETKIVVWYRLRKGSGLYDYDHFLAIFDITTKQWSKLDKNSIGAPNPQGKYLTKYNLIGKDPLIFVPELGYSYDPLANIWQDLAAPNIRYSPAVLAGGKLLYWREQANDDDGIPLPGNGTIYDIASGLWSDMSLENAPEMRSDYRAIWTGTKMLVFGGSTGKQFEEQYPIDVGIFDPDANSWSTYK